LWPRPPVLPNRYRYHGPDDAFRDGNPALDSDIEFHRLTLYTQHVVSLVDHPAILGSILDFYSVTDATQTQTLNAQFVVRDAAGHAFDQRYFNGSHDQMISWTLLPRLAAMDSGDCIAFKPLKVA
jgi:hypothetical protein